MQRFAINVHWIVERHHPAAGWVVVADSDTHASVRSIELAEHKALMWQFVDESLSWLLPRANWRRHTWPTTATPWSAQRERRIYLHQLDSLDTNCWDEDPSWKEARAQPQPVGPRHQLHRTLRPRRWISLIRAHMATPRQAGTIPGAHRRLRQRPAGATSLANAR